MNNSQQQCNKTLTKMVNSKISNHGKNAQDLSRSIFISSSKTMIIQNDDFHYKQIYYYQECSRFVKKQVVFASGSRRVVDLICSVQ
jgi:hypothetical protein